MRCPTCGKENNNSGIEGFVPAILSILQTIIKSQTDQNIAIAKMMTKLSIIEKSSHK